jgi:hypothetical protein
MEPQPVGEPRPGGRRLEDAGDELLLPQRATLRGGEHMIVRAERSLGQVGGELVAEEARQMHGAAGVGLGRTPHQPPIHLSRRLTNLTTSAKEVEVSDPQRYQFAGAKPGVRGKADQQLVARVSGGGQGLDLAGRGRLRRPSSAGNDPATS